MTVMFVNYISPINIQTTPSDLKTQAENECGERGLDIADMSNDRTQCLSSSIPLRGQNLSMQTRNGLTVERWANRSLCTNYFLTLRLCQVDHLK